MKPLRSFYVLSSLLFVVGIGHAQQQPAAEPNRWGWNPDAVQDKAPDTTPAPPIVTKPVIGTIAPDPKAWGKIRFVNVATFPLDGTAESAIERPQLPNSRTLFQSPEKDPASGLPVGQLFHMEYQPTFTTQLPPATIPMRFHDFWEWGYGVKGDTLMPDPVSPFQKNGMMLRKREGTWLTRPPWSLHNGSWETPAGGRNQLPFELIIMEEGDGSLIYVPKDAKHGGARYRVGHTDQYLDADAIAAKGEKYKHWDWRNVKHFTRPWMVDSIRDLEWETDDEIPGRFVKWLDDDMQGGFRSQLVKIPPGWRGPEGHKEYFEKANRFRYMLWGDMKVWQFKNPTDSGEPVKVTPGYFIYQPPRTIWGYGPESASQRGAIWLEVTYAEGFRHGGGLIENPKVLK